jgi:hypothetical protein
MEVAVGKCNSWLDKFAGECYEPKWKDASGYCAALRCRQLSGRFPITDDEERIVVGNVIMKARTPTLLLIAALACGPTTPTSNQAAANDLARSELQTKAGFLYNFALFTTWPTNALSSPTNAIIIGVLGHDTLRPVLREMLTGKQIQQRPIEIRQYQHGREARDCHVLYIGLSEASRLADELQGLGNAPVLTVGDMPGFMEQGGIIGLVKTNDRVAFNVNLAVAQKSGLTLSSKLLRLAAKIVGPRSQVDAR